MEMNRVHLFYFYVHNKNISNAMRKQGITFYGRLVRMNPERLIKIIFDYFDETAKTQVRWFF